MTVGWNVSRLLLQVEWKCMQSTRQFWQICDYIIADVLPAPDSFWKTLNGKFPLKMKVLSGFMHPLVVPNLFDFLLWITKEDVFVCTKKVNRVQNNIGPYALSLCRQKHWAIFQMACFVFDWRKKVTHVWNNMRVHKLWQNFYFWGNNGMNGSRNSFLQVLETSKQTEPCY